jgi:TIR domain-containing protein
MPPGRQRDREIERALTMCKEMLVILSPVAVDSIKVMDEVAFALDEGKTVIPVLHAECRLPFRLRRLQYIDVRSDYEQGLQALLVTLAQEEQIGSAGVAEGAKMSTEVRPDETSDQQKRAAQERIEREKAEAAQGRARTHRARGRAQGRAGTHRAREGGGHARLDGSA